MMPTSMVARSTRPSFTYSTPKISTTNSTTPGPAARAGTSSAVPCFSTTRPGSRLLSPMLHGSTTSHPSPSLTPRPSPPSVLPLDLRQYRRRGRASGRKITSSCASRNLSASPEPPPSHSPRLTPQPTAPPSPANTSLRSPAQASTPFPFSPSKLSRCISKQKSRCPFRNPSPPGTLSCQRRDWRPFRLTIHREQHLRFASIPGLSV
jgi:hypothetical protein